ncbi:hypothetical protein [uncultured Succinivibrio sp.]|uniref:hypothetical protein n=1 Tax=uncultured Succinivibrio sp. TaxID=540749 RepID=UPI0025E77B7D|nr:hypothetical protein [uncultured Succinivibrio sp.]
MNDSTIRLSADTSALTDALSQIAEEMTAMKDAVSSSATAMGANLDASAKQAEATNAAIHGLDCRSSIYLIFDLGFVTLTLSKIVKLFERFCSFILILFSSNY